jgi:hypothetical protein
MRTLLLSSDENEPKTVLLSAYAESVRFHAKTRLKMPSIVLLMMDDTAADDDRGTPE